MKKLTKALMGTTCLTVAAAAPALAGTINESLDFANTYGSATPLPDGTDVVNGTLDWDNDPIDVFSFENLPSGDYTFTYSSDNATAATLYVFGNPLTTIQSNGTFSFNMGESGSALIFLNSQGEFATYTASLTSGNNASGVPEPSTFLLGGAGLAGALAWRRRRSA
jgi:hypothetical protein